MDLAPEVKTALSSGHAAHLATVNADGSPQLSVVWIGLDDDDEIVIGHLRHGRKLTNILRDPRVVLTVETGEKSPLGMIDYLIVHGIATVTEGGAPELLQRLATVYARPGVRFPPLDNPPAGHVIHVKPERIGGVGPWSNWTPPSE
jgi:PPOX class probable F420-dependent enzyme